MLSMLSMRQHVARHYEGLPHHRFETRPFHELSQQHWGEVPSAARRGREDGTPRGHDRPLLNTMRATATQNSFICVVVKIYISSNSSFRDGSRSWASRGHAHALLSLCAFRVQDTLDFASVEVPKTWTRQRCSTLSRTQLLRQHEYIRSTWRL